MRLLGRRSIVALRSGRQHQSLRLYWDWEWHWDGSLGSGLDRWLVLSGHRSGRGTVGVNRSSLGSSVVVLSLTDLTSVGVGTLLAALLSGNIATGLLLHLLTIFPGNLFASLPGNLAAI